MLELHELSVARAAAVKESLKRQAQRERRNQKAIDDADLQVALFQAMEMTARYGKELRNLNSGEEMYVVTGRTAEGTSWWSRLLTTEAPIDREYYLVKHGAIAGHFVPTPQPEPEEDGAWAAEVAQLDYQNELAGGF